MPIHRSRRHRHPRRASSARWDIQGLRAFAVLAVIAHHLLGWPHGGFVGVDVFFVISGFLITGLLLREYETTGQISFLKFYRRRIKRIIPALVLVLCVTVTASWYIFGTSRWRSTAIDAGWSLLFAGNWRFALQSADYFQQDRATSPLQHYWSLGVEEQFYLVWPWLMLLILVVLLRRTKRFARPAVGLAIAAISTGSFLWAVHATADAPAGAYFSTFTRAWELGIGAFLAVAAPAFTKLPGRLRPVLAWIGLIGMTASVFLLGTGSGFSAPSAALPTLAAGLVILAGTGATQQRFLAPLTNPVARYLGDISYSLYLWHFPVIILGIALFGDGSLERAGYAAVILLAAVYSFHLLEDPVRRSGWLSGRKRPRHRRSRRPRARRPTWLTPAYKITALSLVLVADLALVAVMVVPARSTPTASVVPISTAAPDSTAAKVPPKLAALRKEMVAAIGANEWPTLTPTLDAAADDEEAPEVATCGLHDLPTQMCTWGDPNATRSAAIVGDSVGMAYVAAIRSALGTTSGWRLTSYGAYGCSFIDMAPSDAQLEKDCPQRRQKAIEAVNRLRPDVVFVANRSALRTRPGADKPMTPLEQTALLRSELAKLTGAGRLVLLAAPPPDKSIESCYTKTSRPTECVGGVTREWLTVADSEQALAAEFKGDFVNSRDWFCYQDQCPSFVGSTLTKRDKVHMTKEYAERIGPVVLEQLKLQKILRPEKD